ncbi:hypothetical protein N4T77_19080 [Clostridium sp. CX1]|nr:hypothetical protein [Clostridium sp. CX1]MCT8978698.1 hypothetical protein [Clostridium sp. CX1]
MNYCHKNLRANPEPIKVLDLLFGLKHLILVAKFLLELAAS